MGDNWQHRIIVEKVIPAEPGKPYPKFLGANDDARRRIAAACRAITNFSTTCQQTDQEVQKPLSIGIAAPTIRTTLMKTKP
jgi:hypothetical protein